MTRINIYLGNQQEATLALNWFQDVVLTFRGALEQCGLVVLLSDDTLHGDAVNLLLPPFRDAMADWLEQHPGLAYGILNHGGETGGECFARIAAAARFVWTLPGAVPEGRGTPLAWGHAVRQPGWSGQVHGGSAILVLQTPTPYQDAALSALRAGGVPLKVIPEQFPSYLRDDLIRHSPCCLALKPAGGTADPFLPMLLAPLAAGCPVIAETDDPAGFPLAPFCLAVPPADLMATCLAFFREERSHAEALQRARRFAEAGRLAPVLAPLLQKL